MNCPYCQSSHVVKNGTKPLKNGTPIQRYRCHNCRRVFNERTGTPMAGLRTSPKDVRLALKMRSEGMALRASGRVLGYSHSTIANWEDRIAEHEASWNPPAPATREPTVEGDELYTRVGENLPPQ